MTSLRELRVAPAAALSATPLPTPDLRPRTAGVVGPHAIGDEVTASLLSGVAQQTRQVARAQGWTAGWTQGARVARDTAVADAEASARAAAVRAEARDAALATALSSLASATAQLVARTDELEQRLLAQATDLALAVTETVVGQAAAGLPASEAVRRALAATPTGARATLRLPPAVAALVDRSDLPDGVGLVADDTLTAGDTLVELEDGVVDLRVRTALTRVAEALR